MRKFPVVLGVVAAALVAPIVASAQGIEAKLGNDTTATFVVKDSNDMEILVLEAKDQSIESPNVIGGHDSNSVTSGAYGATIGGGGKQIYPNRVTDNYGTVGGGYANLAGDNAGTSADAAHATVSGGSANEANHDYSSIGGGYYNTASGDYSTVGGGYWNTASATYSTVPGGYQNEAGGSHSFAAGRRAKANNQGCFVWGDSTAADVTCSTNNRWVARTSGGVYFYSNSTLTTGVALAAGGSAWGAVSDRAVKENFSPVDKREVLEKVAAMPIEEWNLKSQDPSIRHIGPVAQDFNGAFGFEESERHINMMDATGVTMTALQGLYEVVRDQKKEIEERDRRIEELEGKARRIDELETRLEELARLVRGTGPAK